MLSELKELRTDVALVKSVSAEIAHIRETLQQPAFASPQCPVPAQGVPKREVIQCQLQPYWPSPGTNCKD